MQKSRKTEKKNPKAVQKLHIFEFHDTRGGIKSQISFARKIKTANHKPSPVGEGDSCKADE